MTTPIKEALRAAGIDEKHAIANLMRRLKARARCPDRSRVFAGHKDYTGVPDQAALLAALAAAAASQDTPAYVAAWSTLNKLKA